MKFNTLMVQTLALLVMLSGFSALSPAPAHADFNSTSNQNWMEQVYNANPSFANTSIRDVILPGTHDSGTGVFDDPGFDESLAPDLINTTKWGNM